VVVVSPAGGGGVVVPSEVDAVVVTGGVSAGLSEASVGLSAVESAFSGSGLLSLAGGVPSVTGLLSPLGVVEGGEGGATGAPSGPLVSGVPSVGVVPEGVEPEGGGVTGAGEVPLGAPQEGVPGVHAAGAAGAATGSFLGSET